MDRDRIDKSDRRDVKILGHDTATANRMLWLSLLIGVAGGLGILLFSWILDDVDIWAIIVPILAVVVGLATRTSTESLRRSVR